MVFFTLLAVGCDHTFAPVAASKATTAERPARLLSIVATNTFPCATMGEVMKMFPPALAVQRSCRARTGWSVPIVSLCISLPRSCAHCPETFTEGRVPEGKTTFQGAARPVGAGGRYLEGERIALRGLGQVDVRAVIPVGVRRERAFGPVFPGGVRYGVVHPANRSGGVVGIDRYAQRKPLHERCAKD